MRKEHSVHNGRLVAVFAVLVVVATCMSRLALAKAEHQHDAGGYTEWTQTDALPTAAGKYYLKANVKLAETWDVVAGDTELCLNGKTISLKSGAQGSLIDVPAGANLTVSDCASKAGSLKGGTGTNGKGGVILVEEGGAFTLEDATVSGGKVTATKEQADDPESKEVSLGGGVYVDGSFTMKNSTVENNKAAKGAGVYVSDKGNMSVEGAAKVTDKNKDTSNSASNVVLASGKTIKVADKLEGDGAKKASIGVTLLDAEGNETAGTITSGFAEKMAEEDPSKYFSSNSTVLKVVSNTTKAEARLAGTVTIAFDSNGGAGSMSPVSGEEGTTTDLPKSEFTREGCTFDGWNTSADGSGVGYADEQTDVSFSNMTLYAQWKQDEPEVVMHTVTFNANAEDATGETAAQTSASGTQVALTANGFSRAGYAFEEWNTQADGKGTPYGDGATYDFAADLELYAQWTSTSPAEHTVAFESNGGSEVADQTVTDGQKAKKPEDPTYEGHTFDGWFADEALTQAYDFGASVTSDLTLYAKWTTKTSKVTFKSNGGTKIDPQTVEYGGVVVEPVEPTRTGWIFDGWYKDAECTEEYDFASEVTSNLTLHAKWTAKKLTVKFETNGGSSVKSQKVTYNKTVEEPDDPTKDGYDFVGWFSDKALKTEYSFAAKVTKDLTLYAKWEKSSSEPSDPSDPETDELTITFDKNADDATGTMAPQTAKKGESFAVNANAFTRSGYYFASWNTKADGTGTSVPDKAKVKLNSNVTLYAQWQSGEAPVATDELTITFNKNADDATGTMNPQTAKKGESFQINANAFTRPGYTFSAWNTQPDGSGTKVPNGAMVKLNSSVNLYAQWVQGSSGASGVGGTTTSGETGVSGVKLTYNRGDGAPQVAASNMSTVAQSILNTEERAQGVTLTITTAGLDFNALPGDDQTKISEFTTRYGLTTGAVFDISLSKQVGSNAPVAITDLGQTPLQFTVAVPGDLQATGGSARTFYLLRLHEGEVKALAGTTSATITAKSDKFSTFVIAYRSGSATSASGNPLSAGTTTSANGIRTTAANGTTASRTTGVATARTGDTSVTGIVIGIVAAVGVAAVVIGLRQRKK